MPLKKNVSKENLLSLRKQGLTLRNIASNLNVGFSTLKRKIKDFKENDPSFKEEFASHIGTDKISNEQFCAMQTFLDTMGVDTSNSLIKHAWVKGEGFSVFVKNIQEIKKIQDLVVEAIKTTPAKDFTESKIDKKNNTNKDYLLVFSPSDFHFGKFSSPEEVGSPYNLDIACKRWDEGIEKMYHYTKPFNIEKILFLGGNDLMNADNVFHKTTAGTPQDSHKRWQEVYRCAFKKVAEALEFMHSNITPDIHFLHNVSNHDFHLSFCFSGDTKVQLTDGTTPRFDELELKKDYEVYSRGENNSIVKKKAQLLKTRVSSELIEIQLDNNKIIKCTPDHKFMMRNGSYVEAKDLNVNDSLMPLYEEQIRTYNLKDIFYNFDKINNSILQEYCIYRIFNVVNNKSYIGVAKSGIEYRFNHFHFNGSHKYLYENKNNKHLHSSIRKEGIENFKVEILWCYTYDHIDNVDESNLEEYFINKYDSFLNGYNHNKNGKSLYKGSNKGVICIYKDNQTKRIKPNDFNIYEKKGWNKGLHYNSVRGKVSLYKDNTYKRVQSSLVEEYIKKGWIKKRKEQGSNLNKVAVNNTKCNKYILKENLDEYLKNNWKKGLLDWNKSEKSIGINKNGIYKKVKEEQFKIFEKEGWSKGSIYPSSTLGRIHINKDGKGMVIEKSQKDLYISKGWILGQVTSPLKHNIWINKDGNRKIIKKEEFKSYLREGWIKGSGFATTKGRIIIYKGFKEKKIFLNDIKDYISKGWIKGRCPCNYRKKSINHKVKSIKTLKLKKPIQLYCLQVPDTHNFALESGVFVHNCIAEQLKSYFRNYKSMVFNTDMIHRKYFVFGENLIETDHGDGVSDAKLPNLLMQEAQQKGIFYKHKIKYIVSYRHHYHSKTAVDCGGIEIRRLRASTGDDRWHTTNGYLANPCIEFFIHHKTGGKVAEFSHFYK